jgi:hypothetical protein
VGIKQVTAVAIANITRSRGSQVQACTGVRKIFVAQVSLTTIDILADSIDVAIPRGAQTVVAIVDTYTLGAKISHQVA